VPYVPLSHPFVERLIGTIRRECLDRTGSSGWPRIWRFDPCLGVDRDGSVQKCVHWTPAPREARGVPAGSGQCGHHSQGAASARGLASRL